MNIQELEERDHEAGCFRNEFEAAMSLSQREREPDDTLKINALLAEGKFVVAIRGTDYCGFTDAILGARLTFVAAWDTYQRALIYAGIIEGDEENYAIVLSPTKNEPTNVLNESIPF